MKDTLKAGLEGTKRHDIDRERTIDFMGEALRVYSTPSMLRDIEHTCRDVILAHLNEGEDTVGVRVELEHLGATLLDSWVDISVRVTGVEGPRVDLEVEVCDELGRDRRPREARALRRRGRAAAQASRTPRRTAAGRERRMSGSGAKEHWKPVYCYQCVAGPDLMKVQVEDGVATRIRSNFDASDQHPGGGRVCVKAYGLIQKTYNPHRIRQPMKRHEPAQGPRRGSGVRAGRLGRGPRCDRGEACSRSAPAVSSTSRGSRASR